MSEGTVSHPRFHLKQSEKHRDPLKRGSPTSYCYLVLNSESQYRSPAKTKGWGFPCMAWTKLDNWKGTSVSPGSFENPEAFSGMSLPFPDSLASSIYPRRGHLWEQYLFQTWFLLHHGVRVEEGIWLQGMLFFSFHCFHQSSLNQLFWLSDAQTLTPWDTLTWWRGVFQRRKSNSSSLLPLGGFPGTKHIQQVYCYLYLEMAGGSGPEASILFLLLPPFLSVLGTVRAWWRHCKHYLCSWMWDKGREFLSSFTPWFPEGWWINCVFHSYCSCFPFTCLLAFSHWDIN